MPVRSFSRKNVLSAGEYLRVELEHKPLERRRALFLAELRVHDQQRRIRAAFRLSPLERSRFPVIHRHAERNRR